ncbi:methyltransferase domain-containing protein [Micromonospora sp. NPDC049559]|uniref:methyltransferase domain-containing protein n=1 Tax=Micromonospora sp. NPDC049559 TaxID=3155923 RepID=UPI003423FBAE
MTEIDERPRPESPTESLVRRLDAAETLPEAVRLRERSYELLRVVPGTTVLDVGCGAGRAVAELGARGARAVGVDVREEMVAVARDRWPDGTFRTGDAYDLPFADGEFAAYRADKVYHELDAPPRALAEAHRVLAPGGRVVLVGQDWDAFVIDSDDPGLTRTIVRARADTIASPRAARGYRNLLLDAGFEGVTAEVRTGVFTDATMLPMLAGLADAARACGAVTAEQADAWRAEQAGRAEVGRLFLAVPIFLAAGRRP